MFFGGALIVGRWGVAVWSRKSYLEPAEIASSYSRDFSRSNKHDTFYHVVSTRYFDVLFLWAIAVSDFRLLSAIFLKSTATQLNKFIYLFQILYSMKSIFLLKYMLKVHWCRFENLTICSCSYKDKHWKLRILNPKNYRVLYPWSLQIS